MRPSLLDLKSQSSRNIRGFTIIEMLLSMALAVGAGTMIASYVSNVSKARKNSIMLMAVDAVERQVTSISGKISLLESSIEPAFNAGELTPSQINCFISRVHCDSISVNSSVTIPLLVNEGSRSVPLTGPEARYNYSGDLYTKKCQGIEVSTTIFAVCQSGTTCPGSDFYLVQNSYKVAQIPEAPASVTSQIPMRRRTQEVRRFMAKKLFPGISIACPDSNQVLNGISLTGNPMCTPVAKMEYEDRETGSGKGTFKITPTECGNLDYVSEIRDPSGEVICARRFW